MMIVLSGPKATTSQARTALATAGLAVTSTPHDHGLVPDDTREPQAYITVEGDIDHAQNAAGPLGWRLRAHWHKPPARSPNATETAMRDLDELRARVAELEGKVG